VSLKVDCGKTSKGLLFPVHRPKDGFMIQLCAGILQHMSVSRHHATLTLDPSGHLFLTDLGAGKSVNASGLYVCDRADMFLELAVSNVCGRPLHSTWDQCRWGVGQAAHRAAASEGQRLAVWREHTGIQTEDAAHRCAHRVKTYWEAVCSAQHHVFKSSIKSLSSNHELLVGTPA
jgi:FHA domain